VGNEQVSGSLSSVDLHVAVSWINRVLVRVCTASNANRVVEVHQLIPGRSN
jgi:hypothetical protein